MDLNKLVIENEKLIHKFIESTASKDDKCYVIYSALNALENNNELQKYYLKSLKTNITPGEAILRLYALFQGLFVSVDSLYSLAYALTNSKSFININQNRELRELKYIRNDVVGHPSNRIYNNNTVGYCILYKENVTAYDFSYTIHTNDTKKDNKVDIMTILNNYYLEANNLLDNLFSIKNRKTNDVLLSTTALKIYEAFNANIDYMTQVYKLKKQYLKYYNKNLSRHRLLWRIDLLADLNKKDISTDVNVKELFDYAIMYEIIKTHELCSQIDKIAIIELNNKLKTPKYLIGFFKMLNSNFKLVDTVKYLFDATNPLFVSTLYNMIDIAIKKRLKDAHQFLKILEQYYYAKEYDLVYSFGTLAKTYKKRKI